MEEPKNEVQSIYAPKNCFCKPKVLIVDDSPFNLLPLRITIERFRKIDFDKIINFEMPDFADK